MTLRSIKRRQRWSLWPACAALLAACSGEPLPADDSTDQQRLETQANEPVTSAVALSSSKPACLTYGDWRRTVTSDGPAFPLPRFADEVERRCVTAFEDIRTSYIIILPAGELPSAGEAERSYGSVPKAALPGIEPGSQSIQISGVVALGGQANADALLSDDWSKPSVGFDRYLKLSTASWRGVTITGPLGNAALWDAIGSLQGDWRPLPPGAKGNQRLDAMDVAANWHRVPDGRHTFAPVGALRLSDSMTPDVVQMDKRGTRVTAFLFPLEGDSVGCYVGTLDPAGKLTNVRFTDPVFGGEDGQPAVQRVGDVWPDHLTEAPLRPASPRVMAAVKGRSWGPDLCREAFAKPGQMGVPQMR